MENGEQETVIRFCGDCCNPFATTDKNREYCPECEHRHKKAAEYEVLRRIRPVAQIHGTGFIEAHNYLVTSQGNVIDVDKKAQQVGLSYGKYVAKYRK